MSEWRPSRLSTGSWAVYDLANTIFALGIAGLYFPDWLLQVRGDGADGSLSWAITGAMAVVIVVGPWLGARTDHSGRRIPALAFTTGIAVVATFFLGGDPTISLVLFAVALVGVNLGSVLYDALLPDVSTEQNRGRISGLGVGVGYIGSFVALLIGGLFLDSDGYQRVFQAIAVAFLVFSLPTFLWVREQPRLPQSTPPPTFRSLATQLRDSWRRARTYPGVARFLVGRFFYADGINTLISGFLTIFVRTELGFSVDEVEGLLGLAIATAMVGSLVGGFFVDRLGPRRLLHTALYLWMFSMSVGIVAAAISLKELGWALGAVGGVALGLTWTADRVYMARLSPPRFFGEFYGLYATVGRFASVVGPFLWGRIVDDLGWPREIALGVLLAFVVIARFILEPVDDRLRVWDQADK